MVNDVLLIPPTQALLFALLPTLAWRISHLGQRPISLTFVPLDWLAPAWLVISLLAAANVWQWPTYTRGLLDLTLMPVLIYGAIRLLITTPREWRMTAWALLLGGVLAAGFGLITWLQGEGTAADGIRRLVGPHFSPNHTALYLARTFFLGCGLAIAAYGRTRWLTIAATALTGLALVLTGSRGALLLAMPVGSAVLVALSGFPKFGRPSLAWPSFSRSQSAVGPVLLLALIMIGVVMIGVVFIMLGWERLSNSATIVERCGDLAQHGGALARLSAGGRGAGGLLLALSGLHSPRRGHGSQPTPSA